MLSLICIHFIYEQKLGEGLFTIKNDMKDHQIYGLPNFFEQKFPDDYNEKIFFSFNQNYMHASYKMAFSFSDILLYPSLI